MEERNPFFHLAGTMREKKGFLFFGVFSVFLFVFEGTRTSTAQQTWTSLTIIQLDYFLTRFLSSFAKLTTHIPIYNLKFAFKVTKPQSTVVLVTFFHIIVGN